jgi:hypothetical protein
LYAPFKLPPQFTATTTKFQLLLSHAAPQGKYAKDLKNPRAAFCKYKYIWSVDFLTQEV